MKVRAIKRGFFGGLYRKPGDEFDCPSEAEFSKNWMKRLGKGKAEPIPKPKKGYIPLEIPSLMNKKPTKKSVKKSDKE